MLTWASSLVRSAGYGGLGAMIALETIFPPIPSEVVLPLAGFEVQRGHLVFGGALGAATLGALLGAFVLYAIARAGGRPLVLRHGRILRVRPADLERGERWFDRYGSWVVLLGRLVPGARSLVSLPAGLARMPLGRFALLTAIGSGLWNALLIGLGWTLGEEWHRVGDVVGPLSTALVVALAVATPVLLVRWYRRRTPA